jgi:hypothetical protein
LRIKEQETCLTLQEHDDDDDIIFDLNNSTIVYPQLILQMPVAFLGLFTTFLVAVPKGEKIKSHVKMTDANFTTLMQSVNKQKRTHLI